MVKRRIQTEVLRVRCRRLRTHNDRVRQQRWQGEVIVDIRCGGNDRQRHAASVNQHFVFHPRFRAVGGIRAIVWAPQGGAHIRAITALPLSLNAVARLVVLEANPPEVGKEFRVAPLAEARVNR